ncbi:MAG: L,D-transpeptidase family protein [Novosphingobium sp.]|nr:L,D-transpeptidase family protein [Novosphingobium sp.]MCB2078423.1 L,D-transpeptidase family protein [Novosphingobium sp.]
MKQGIEFRRRWLLLGAALAIVAQPATAQPADEPESILPDAIAAPEPAEAPQVSPSPAPAASGTGEDMPTASIPVIQPLPVIEPVMVWTLGDAQALLGVIEGIGSEGLIPADYQLSALRQAILAGEGDELNTVASKSFSWLAEDLRDGRTPVTARVQWFAVDPDQDVEPTEQLMAAALETHDVPGVLAGLAPTHPDYEALKTLLAETPETEEAKRALIRANMDRWRWLARDLGEVYLITNVPEFQLRLTVRNRIIRTYRTIVGKPGRTATPQLAEEVEAVVFNPTWTVPQSIVKGEGLGARLLANPASARRQGYKVTKGADGTIYVVQQPGPGNSLGLMKIDIPNPHAIYFHDTPSKQLFDREVRAFSHGCIRTERAVELGMTMAILGAELPPGEAADISRSGKYTKVEMTRTFPAYITYFTLGRDIDGDFRAFNDIYGRDKPVLESFEAPREAKTTQRKSNEPIIQLDNPL